ncbi:MAG: glycosyltransferase [[Clostridium] symbiosum]
MVKVCHFTSVHDRYDVRIFQKQCISLVELGYDVILVVNDDLPDENIQGVKIVSTGSRTTKNRLKRYLNEDRHVYRLAVKIDADIYCFHDPELLRYAKLLNGKNKKVIFDSHEFYALQLLTKNYIPKCLRKIVSQLYQTVELRLLRYIDAVITPCTIDGKNYFQGKTKKTVFIGNYPKISEFYNAYNPNEVKENTACYTGSLTFDRGIYYLGLASNKIEGKIVLAGQFSSIDFQKQIMSVNRKGNLFYAGVLPKNNVLQLYKKTRIGICTLLDAGQYYHIDTLPTKAYEYMSMGMPVIISDTNFVTKLLKKYSFGLSVKSDDIDEIADAVAYLLEHPEVALEMGAEGRRMIHDIFNWEKEAKKLGQLYSEL